MTEVLDRSANPPPAATDLASEVQRVLAASPEPLTLSKIRSQLPTRLRSIDLNDLADALQRQVAANVVYPFPKYRSAQDRFWDRGMTVHIAALLRQSLEAGPLPWSELRRKLPAYAHPQAQEVLEQQIAQGLLHRHPRAGGRGAERVGANPPDPKDYLRQELPALFGRLAGLGFTAPQLRAAALELLHEEEWDLTPPAEPPARRAGPEREEGPEPSEPLRRPPAVAEAAPPAPAHGLSGPHATGSVAAGARPAEDDAPRS
jgi:hypothetical protein